MIEPMTWFAIGVVVTLSALTILSQLPRFWKRLKFKVWFNLRYAEGYRKGLADGRRIEQQWNERS